MRQTDRRQTASLHNNVRCPVHQVTLLAACTVDNTYELIHNAAMSTDIIGRHVFNAASPWTIETWPNVGLFVWHRLILLHITLAHTYAYIHGGP